GRRRRPRTPCPRPVAAAGARALACRRSACARRRAGAAAPGSSDLERLGPRPLVAGELVVDVAADSAPGGSEVARRLLAADRLRERAALDEAAAGRQLIEARHPAADRA